jgi:hypothetical protein
MSSRGSRVLANRGAVRLSSAAYERVPDKVRHPFRRSRREGAQEHRLAGPRLWSDIQPHSEKAPASAAPGRCPHETADVHRARWWNETACSSD